MAFLSTAAKIEKKELISKNFLLFFGNKIEVDPKYLKNE